MQELVQFKADFSSLTHSELSRRVREDKALQERIETLYYKYLPAAPRLNKGCGNCYMDACIVLLTTKTDTLMEKSQRQFILRAGITLRDMSINQGQIYSHHNLTDEVAVQFIRLHEGDAEEFITKFAAYPADWRTVAFPPKTEDTSEVDNRPQEAEKKPVKQAKKSTPKTNTQKKQ